MSEKNHKASVLICVFRAVGTTPTGEEFITSSTGCRAALRALSAARGWVYSEGSKHAWEADGKHSWFAMRLSR